MEDKNVQKLLDMLYGMIDEAKGATFSSEKCVINRDEALDLLDEIRNKLPGELSKAQELMKSREQYVDQANREVKRMVEQAKEDAGRILDRAQKEATQILERPRRTPRPSSPKARPSSGPSAAAARSSARPRTAAASCIRWPTPTPRMPCAGRRKPFRPLWTRCGSPASAIAAPPPNRCRPARRSSSPPLPPLPRRNERILPPLFVTLSNFFTRFAEYPHTGLPSHAGMRFFCAIVEQEFYEIRAFPGKMQNSRSFSGICV